MDALTVYHSNLPDTIEDLTKFALIGREKVTVVRAEIRAISKLGLAEEVRRQKLEEAQMISEAVLDAEIKIGILTAKIKPEKGGDRKSGKYQCDSAVGLIKTKSETIKAMGFSPKQVERFEILAKNPEVIEQAKAEARESDDIVSRSFVLERIKNADRQKNGSIVNQIYSNSVNALQKRRRANIAVLLLTRHGVTARSTAQTGGGLRIHIPK